MDVRRIIKHLLFPAWKVGRAFPPTTLDVIQAAIHSSEQMHVGEIRFVVEGALDGLPLWRGQSARERAIDVFSHLRIWDTEHNSGVLIYVLLADRAVEVIADRGIHTRTGSARWNTLCRDMEVAFSRCEFQSGCLAGIAAVTNALGQHFPAQGKRINELPDAPLVLN